MEFAERNEMSPVFSLISKSSEEVFSMLKRSRSHTEKRIKKDDWDNNPQAFDHPKSDLRKVTSHLDVKNKGSPPTMLQVSLKKEILQLERHLQDQLAERRALEKALRHGISFDDASDEVSMVPKPTKELIREIAVLELEVVHLEQYLLSLYRDRFNPQISSLSPSTLDGSSNLPLTAKGQVNKVQSNRLPMPQTAVICAMKEYKKSIDQSFPRSDSTLSQRTICSTKPSPPVKNSAKTLKACQSLPLSYQENDTSSVISLAEHLGTRIEDLVPETPNRISEDMIRCMGAIYCKLAKLPLVQNGVSSSPTSSFSSISIFSPRDQFDVWSPRLRRDSYLDERLEDLFKVEGMKDFSGPYSTMVEVLSIMTDTKRLSDVEHMLQDFRSLVLRLEKVDLKNMKNEEKLAFWINIHNALIMHAYLSESIPQSSLKRGLLLMKAVCNVGGQTISADTIQTYILGCHTRRPRQWLRTFFSQKMKFKGGDNRQSYAIIHPEPLLHFALCSGSHSDPAVRVYTAKRVVEELEAAKEEYISSIVNIHREHKILLPKIMEVYAKQSSLSSTEVVDMIKQSLPETRRKAIERFQRAKSRTSIEWVPHNFAFRYLLSKELAK